MNAALGEFISIEKENVMSIDPNLIGKYLEEKLKVRPYVTTTYGEIAKNFGLPDFDGNWGSHPLSQIFEVLDQQDANANRPFRTSIVTGASNNSPGPGLYEALDRLKNIKDPKTANAREAIWLNELNNAYNHTYP